MERRNYYDIAKFIAIFSVIIYHVENYLIGNWFLLTLFEFLCVYRYLIGLISRVNNLLIKILILFSPFVVVNLLCVFLPADISCWLSLMSFRRYYLFFAAGYALSNIFEGYNIFNNKVWMISSILYILGTFFYVQYVKSVDDIIDLVIWTLTNLVGCHFWLCLCRRFEKNFSNPIVLNIGRNTMGIYTLHYFSLRCLQYLHDNGFISMGEGKPASTCYFCLSVLVIISLAYCMTVLASRNKYSSIVFLGKV